MSELRLAVMREDIPSSSPISCGIASIDDRIKDAYSKTICKQGLAYNIYVDGYLIGNCMIKLVVLCDEANDYYVTDHEYAALEISYIAIDRRVQGNGIGTRVLARLISDAEKLLSKIREKLSNITEGTDLIETIPDIDISSLLNVGKFYSPSDVFFNSGSIDIGSIATTSAPHSNYFIGLDTTISAA